MLHRACRSGDLDEIVEVLRSDSSLINDKDTGVKFK
jgi:hypothetical protein